MEVAGFCVVEDALTPAAAQRLKVRTPRWPKSRDILAQGLDGEYLCTIY
jgi:hypothetical protein